MRMMGEVMSTEEFPQTRSWLFLVYRVMAALLSQAELERQLTEGKTVIELKAA